MWAILTSILFVAVVLKIDCVQNLKCNQTDVIHGVPSDLDFDEKDIFQDVTFKDCINQCCQNETCQAAGIYRSRCINARCKSQSCLADFLPDSGTENAEFVFLLRPDFVELVPKSAQNDNSKKEKHTPEHAAKDTVEGGLEADTQASNSENKTVAQINTNLENDKKSENITNSENESKSANKTVLIDSKTSAIEDTKEVEAKTESLDSKDIKNENNDASLKEVDKDQEANKHAQNDTTENAEENNVCDPKCKDNELCSKLNDQWTCSCKEGYTSKDSVCVEQVVCTDDSCNDVEHSTCTVIDNAITCPCPTGYKLKGGKCIEVSCKKIKCPLHASCAVADNNAKCYCDHSFVAQGAFCRKEVKCTTASDDKSCPTNEMCKQVVDNTQCECIPGKVRDKHTAGNCTGDAPLITMTTDDVTVTLPVESATLSTTVSPAHKDNYYTYKWEQQSSPKTSEDGSVVAGLTKSKVTISKLVAGEYVFSVSVTGLKNEFLSKVVKLTVEPEAHTNEPPVAVIKPSGNQSFKLPADFSINGIDSTDDEKITSFTWTIDKKPVASKDHVILEGENTDTLHVQITAGEGEFTFKLQVKDEDGLTSSANKSVTILAEDDFPPSAKVSAGIAITLPDNSVVLSGTESSDDHGITKWEWQKSAESPNTGDMTGTTTDTLTLTNLVEGTYTFTLTVFDKKEHKSSATTTVTVRPAEKGPPVAEAGDNKELIMPDHATELDGSKSHSPLGELTYYWELAEGPEGVILKYSNTSKLSVAGLGIGVYRFKLTVTDTTKVNATDEVTITVKADDNKPPVAVLGKDIVIYAPNTAVDIDGSHSTDDSGIVRWEWSRSLTSPALGQVVSGSNHGPILKLCDLIVGEYTFTLTVYDDKDLSSSASISVSVRSNPHAADIVQVYLFEDAANFTQDRLNSLVDILMVPFRNSKERSIKQWDLVTISVTTIDSKVVVYFYGRDEEGKIMEGAPLVQHLRDTVYGKLLGFNFDIIDTTTCSNDCGGHGTCSDDTRLCTCDKFWMENYFRASAGRQFSNCEWSKIYFGIVVIAILVAFLIVIYTVYCILSLRNNQAKRRRKYRILEEETGRGVNLDSSEGEDSDLFTMKKIRKSNSGQKLSNGFMPANVLNNAGSSNSAKKK